MKGPWKVSCNGAYYEVFRLRDIERVDCGGNREYSGPAFGLKAMAQVYADGMNKGEEVAKQQQSEIHDDMVAKIGTLMYFMKSLDASGRHFDFMLTDNGNTVEITDMNSGSKRKVNVACDSAPAMLLDILKQAGDWIL